MSPLATALCLATAFSFCSAGPALAQDDKNKFLDDALEALDKAKRRRLLDDSTEKLEKHEGLIDGLRKRAGEAAQKNKKLPSLDLDSVKSQADAEALVKGASPEARRLIARSRKGDKEPPAAPAPSPATPRPGGNPDPSPGPGPSASPSPATAPSIGGVPIPRPDTGPDAPMTNSDSGGKKVRIVCKGNSFYDQSGNVMLFRKDVVAEHPGFRINCEEMEVLLEDNTVGFGDHAKSAAPGKGRDASGIRRAVAMGKGSLIDLVRFTPKGNLMGKCGYAIYDGRTGDIELHDWPVVSNGTRVYRAKKKETIMTIRQNGNHVVKGEAIEEAAGKEGL